MSNAPKKIEGPIHMKLCLLGDGRVGKTSLRREFLGEGFVTEYKETLGADFAIHTQKYNDITFRFQIWDLAGQERFDQLRTSFYFGAQAALVLYDVSNQKSLNSVENWISELWEHNGKNTVIPIVIIGNKIDLRNEIVKSLKPSAGQDMAKQMSNKANNIQIPFLETSAKTGENVAKAFSLITETFMTIHNFILG